MCADQHIYISFKQKQGPLADDLVSFTPCFQDTVLFAIPAILASVSFVARSNIIARRHGLGHTRSARLYWPAQLAMAAAVIVIFGHALQDWSQHTALAALTMIVSWVC
jgi:hypothetical protein